MCVCVSVGLKVAGGVVSQVKKKPLNGRFLSRYNQQARDPEVAFKTLPVRVHSVIVKWPHKVKIHLQTSGYTRTNTLFLE